MKLPTSAICVQSFDDSLSPAIHTTYRISLRSSSLREPRHPLLRVVLGFFLWPTLSRNAAFRCLRCYNRVVDKKNYVAAHLLQDPKSIETLREIGTRVHIQNPSLPLSVSPARTWICVCPQDSFAWVGMDRVSMILPQVHLRKPCYDFSFL